MSSRLDLGSVGSSTAVQTVSSVSYGGFPVKASVTSEMVSQAVEEILPNVDVSEEVRTSLRKLLATDVDAAHAKDMFLSSVEKAGASYSTLEKAKVNISQELTREAVSELTAYAPEYTLRFHNGENHDHGPAAAKRQIDTRILHDSLPMRARPAVIDGRAAVSVKDIGGDPMHYVLHGITGVHVCCPLYDVKDPQRFVTRDLRCKVILADPSSSDDQRLMAQRYLVRDPTFVCGKLAQDCDVVAAACMSVHVYDVEMSEWPQILQAASCGMHRGCLLFPKEAYSRSSGVLGATAGEYEVDLDQGKIYMGFRNSPAWWYSHNWLDFMRYGVDQLISTSNGTYSYHVSEVRGDTIFFEILMVSDYAEVQEQCYRLPGVRMVRVDGFETAAGGSRDPVTGGFTELRPKVHWFPEPLWNDMVSHASLLFERNVMTYDKLFNHYRSVSPRNTINGVLISGGHRVSMSEVVPLVVHAGICGASASLLGQKTSKGLIGREMRQRLASKRGSLKLMFDSIVTALKVSSGIFSPFVTLLSRMRGVTDAVLLDSLVQWSVVPQVQVVDFSSLVGSADLRRYGATFKLGDAEMMLHVVAASSMPADHARAQGQLEQLRESVTSALGGSEEPVQALGEQDTRPTASDDLDVEEQSRLAAIRECIEEHELEGKHLAEYVKMVHKAVTDSVGRPVEEVLRRRAEEYGQPDMWLVRGGVLCDSVLGSLVSDFRHSAVHVMDDKGSRVVTVVEEEVENSKGEVRDVLTLGDCSIDGWVLTVDSLVIYNGPRILEALRAALLVSHRYEVTVMQGAPGCGKTYTLLEQMGPDDVALCPARESALDTRKRGQKKYPWYTKPKWRWASLDSYLSNYEQRKDLRADVLRADEIFIDKKGKFCAAAGLLGVRAVKGYGDDKQIPPFQRVQMVAKHSKTTANKIENEYRVFRLPGDALAAVAKFYDFKVRTFNPIARSITVVTDWRQLEVPDGKVYALVMYQADKKEVRKMLKSLIEQGKVVVMSVHESQGKTLSNVWLFRIDSRQRSDNMCLFDRQEYALVAMTRHDKTFAYIRPRDLGDKIDQWAKVASDPRRIAAAMDTGTLGQSIEML